MIGLSFKISCTCGCAYSINEDINVDKVACPNCGLPHPHSDKLISVLKLSSEIPGACSEEDVFIKVMSQN